MKVKNLMTHHTHSCRPDQNLQQISLDMWNGDFGIEPVMDDDNKVIGVITDRDIAMAIALQSKPPSQILVSEVIGDHELTCCSPDDDVEKVLEAMETQKIRRLPVVNDDGELTGMVSFADIAAYAGPGKSASCSATRLLSALKAIAPPHIDPEKMMAQA